MGVFLIMNSHRHHITVEIFKIINNSQRFSKQPKITYVQSAKDPKMSHFVATLLKMKLKIQEVNKRRHPNYSVG